MSKIPRLPAKTNQSDKILKEQAELNGQILSCIFTTDTQQDEELNEKMLQILINQVKTQEIDTLRLKINLQLCNIMHDILLNPSIQKKWELLNLLEIVAFRGGQWTEETNEFYDIMFGSKLLNMFESLLNNKLDIEEIIGKELNNEKDINLQLVRVYFYAMKGKTVQRSILKICLNIIINNLTNLLEQIRILNLKHVQDNHQEILISDEFESAIIQTSKAIQALSFISASNHFYLTNKFQIQVHISPLIHINCSGDQKCPQNFYLPNIPAVQELQSSFFHLLNLLSEYSTNVKKYFVQQENALPHVASLIISFANENRNNLGQHLTESEIVHTPTSQGYNVILESIKLLKQLLGDNDHIKIASKIPGLFPTLTNLTRFKIFGDKYQEEKSTQFQVNIRLNSLECFQEMHYSFELNFLSALLTENKIIRVLTQSFGVCGGSCEQNQRIILCALKSLYNILNHLHGSGYFLHQNSTQELREIEEQIEEEDSCEDLEVHLFHTKQMRDQTINNADYTRNEMMNIYKNWTIFRN